ncbi:hypothetical protein ACWD7F_25525 [Streptomyces sp. NPDC005122]
MTTPNGRLAPPETIRPKNARLEILRRRYEREVVESARRVVRVAPYVLVGPGAERRADLDLIEDHVRARGWHITRASFADVGQAPPITQRSGFGEAFVFAAQGFAHGIVAIGREAITTDDAAYEHVLDELGAHGVFLTFLPAEDGL